MTQNQGGSRNRFILAIEFFENQNGWSFVADKGNTGVPQEIVIMQVGSFLKEAEDDYFVKPQNDEE